MIVFTAYLEFIGVRLAPCLVLDGEVQTKTILHIHLLVLTQTDQPLMQIRIQVFKVLCVYYDK